LKAANTIEAAPHRVERKQAFAEEPVTTRIRRRQEANADLRGDDHGDEVTEGITPRPQRTFQERIATERQRPQTLENDGR
jgi:hypothetical protein